MKRIGIFVGEGGDWRFFREIFGSLTHHYRVSVHERRSYNLPILHGRLNRWAFKNGIRSILSQSDLCIFEWVSELLVAASHMPKYCPIIARLHSYELYAWAPMVNWEHVDKVVLVSQAIRRKFSDLYPEHAHKTVVVYNAVSLEKFHPNQRNFGLNLGMLCELNPRKRVYEVIMMMRDLRQDGCNAHLHIAGGRKHAPDCDEYYVAIHELVRKLGLRDRVTFYEHVDRTSDWLRKIDIFISNSYWEGQQVALIEAMATGCYCLSHFWGGAEEMLPDENLYVTENDLAQKIIEHSSQTEQVRRERQDLMRAIACKKFNIEQQKAAVRSIVEETIMENPVPGRTRWFFRETVPKR